MKAFVDSDILIWHLRGKDEAKKVLHELTEADETDACIGAMQRAEIVFFMPEGEKELTLELLSLFKTYPVDEEIIDQAGRFFRKWHPSHGIDPNDAILAAAVAVAGGQIVTQNVSHYPMPEIVVRKGW